MDGKFLTENMMGPNAWRIARELTEGLPLGEGMRVLDLGCGRGLSSVFLAQTFGVQVFAADLWTSATENHARFRQAGVSDRVVPLQLDALRLPFAAGFFDAVVSIDAYHYFGGSDSYFPQVLRPLLKQDAPVAIAFPGMKFEVQHAPPAEMRPFWEEAALKTWHSIDWWQPKFAPHLNNFQIAEMDCFDEAWGDWLACDNPYAAEDRQMMAADGGRYMNLIRLTGNVR